MSGAIATTCGAPQQVLTLAGLEAAVEKLRGIPPAKWLLVAPDGSVWSEEDPAELMRILALRVYGGLPIPILPQGAAP